MAVVRHLGFLTVVNLNFRSGLEAQRASSCRISIRSVKPFPRYRQFFIFQDGGRPPSYACWDHPRRVFVDLCDCAKFGCNRRSNVDSMQILIFGALRLKMPIHAPKIGGLWDFTPKMEKQYERDSQRAHPWSETRRMTYRSSKSVHLCGLGASRSIKQKNKKGIPKKPQQVFFHMFDETTHVVAAPHGFACVSIPATWLYIPSFSEIRSGVSEPQGSKFGLSHYFGYSLLQQLVGLLPYKPLWIVLRLFNSFR